MTMQHRIAPNQWSCLITSFAMILDKTIDDIIEVLKHDGSEIFWPELKDPYCRRGFHIQEMIDYCYLNGFLVTPFEPIPCSQSFGSQESRTPKTFLSPDQRIELINHNKGVIGGIVNNHHHAVAWDGIEIYDPNGTKYEITNFQIQTFWIITKSNHIIENKK